MGAKETNYLLFSQLPVIFPQITCEQPLLQQPKLSLSWSSCPLLLFCHFCLFFLPLLASPLFPLICVCVCVYISEWLTVSETVVWSLSTQLWCLLACLVYLCGKCTCVFCVWVPVEKSFPWECWGRARFMSTWEPLSSLWSTLCWTVVALYSL